MRKKKGKKDKQNSADLSLSGVAGSWFEKSKQLYQQGLKEFLVIYSIEGGNSQLFWAKYRWRFPSAIGA